MLMDKYRLEYEMKSRGITTEKLCKDLNISRTAFYRKRNGKSEFTLSEIQMIIDYLDLGTPMGIFFENKVS
jgi:transcriptional regulator with XRE-family HTH domain